MVQFLLLCERCALDVEQIVKLSQIGFNLESVVCACCRDKEGTCKVQLKSYDILTSVFELPSKLQILNSLVVSWFDCNI